MDWGTLRASKWGKIAACIGIFVAGIAVGYALTKYSAKPSINVVREPKSGYTFINPVLYTEVPESLSYPKYTPLKNALTTYAAQAKGSGSAQNISIYFRDLNASQWVGVDAKETYNPASMLKVVTLIGLLQASESNPRILSGQISVPATIAIPTAGGQDYYPPADPVVNGRSYSVSDLMRRMIVQSDNGANALVTTLLGDALTNTNYENLHISLPKNGTDVEISPQEYSHLFRILYNSSYLNTSDSEKALQLLSQTTFTAGLTAGVPPGTVVAHKFGENVYDATARPMLVGLNDCGIVYYPAHPYFLCVMTKGTDFPTLAGVIKSISATTWQQVQQVYPTH